jgi:hypothetical protein
MALHITVSISSNTLGQVIENAVQFDDDRILDAIHAMRTAQVTRENDRLNLNDPKQPTPRRIDSLQYITDVCIGQIVGVANQYYDQKAIAEAQAKVVPIMAKPKATITPIREK